MEVNILQRKFQYLSDDILALRDSRRKKENQLNNYFKVAHKLFINGEYLKCIKYADKAIQYGDFDNPQKALIQSYQLLSMSNKHFGRMLNAIQYSFISLKLAEQINNSTMISFIYNNLSVIYKTMNDLDKSLEYALLSIELKDELKEPLSYARSCANAALIYKAKKDYNKAVILTKKSIKLFEESNSPENTASALCNLSVCYFEMGDVSKAIDTVNKSLTIFTEFNSRIGVINDYLNLCKFNIELENFREAEKLLNKVDSEFELNDLLRAEFLSLRHLLDYKTGKYESAYKTLIEYNELKSRIDESQNRKQIADIELDYQLKKKTREAEAYKKKNDELDNLNKELSRISSIKNKLISVIGHDLKIPLTSIFSASEMLIEYSNELGAEQKTNFLKVVYNSADNLNNMLNNLLQWSKYLDNTNQIETTRVNINSLIDNTRKYLSRELEKKSIVILNNETSIVHVKSDLNILQIVLRNIIFNAVKFSPSGSHIIVSSSRNDNQVTLSVTDFGVGMTETQVNSILNKNICFTTSGTMNEKGNGIGLRICMDLLEMMNCHLEIDSKEKQGSTFSIIFPAENS